MTGGLATTVLAGLLLVPVGGRLCLGAAARAAAVTVFAIGALGVDLFSADGVDGRAAALLAMSACLMVAGRVRTAVAALGVVLAIVVSPPVAVAVLVLLAAMAFSGGLGARWPAARRRRAGVVALVAAAGLLVWLRIAAGGSGIPYPLLGVLTAWAVAVVGPVWWREPWLRPVCAATVVLVATCWFAADGTSAAVVALTVLAVLTMILLAEVRPRVRAAVLVIGVPMAVAGLVAAPAPPVAASGEPAALLVTPSSAGDVRPVRVRIPAIGVDGPLGELGVDGRTGELVAPADASLAGWYAAGVVPGDPGPAVVGGHVDTRTGPGVFFRLGDLRPGDSVEITRSDARTATFVVTDVRTVAKTAFPTDAVYGPAPGPELRLVTCGGEFDRSAHGYSDNVIVAAVVV